MKKAILVGCGAEIGANLLIQNNPQKDGFVVQCVVTNPPAIDKHYPELRPIDGIVARLAMAQPGIQSRVGIISDDTLQLDGREIHFFFGDLAKVCPPVIEAAIERVNKLHPHVVMASRSPLGGRAYAYERRCSTILSDVNHLLILRPAYLAKQNLSEVIIQSFVNNSVGYTAVVRAVARNIAQGLPVTTFQEIEK
ncbi:hypothetical protein ACQSFK_17405 [Salmonella enterica]|uniref:hypothetical protein n=1 Tax=Salmonella enterica TaxID=28901 RepID=UPI003D3226F0